MGLLSKIFKKKTNKEQENMSKKLYDIVVYDYDEGGKVMQHQESGLHASSPKDLASLYEACGQKIKILREYDDPDAKAEQPVQATVPQTPSQASVPVPAPVPMIPIQNQSSLNSKSDITVPSQQSVVVKEEPKFFTIAGIECKMEDGKIYQKQWVRIFENEMKQYRVISDANNKEIPMQGKHIEILKWVLVEGTPGT